MLTYAGKPAFAVWADLPAIKFGQLLIRLSTAARAVGEHDAKLARMDAWLNDNECDPRWQERFQKREDARITSDVLRSAEHQAMAQAADFLADYCPDLKAQWGRLWQLLAQYGGQWPADPEHLGDPMRRVAPDQLGAAEPPF